MGMLTEIHASDGSVYWIVCGFPGEMNDVKWVAFEEQYGEARTPQDVCYMIWTTVPYTGDSFLRPATRVDCWDASASIKCVYKVADAPLMRSMPVWNFMKMVAFAEAI